MKKAPIPKGIKPDLKHDTMEYSAASDGDDIYEEEVIVPNDPGEITAEELNALEDDTIIDQAVALNEVEMERGAVDEMIFDENDTDSDDYDEDKEKPENDHIRS